MECLLTFLVLLAMLTVAIRLSSGSDSRSARRRNYQHLAKEFAGVYMPGGLLTTPKVRFRYGTTTAVLTETKSPAAHGNRCTQMQIRWPDFHLRAEIRPAGQALEATSLRGMKAVTSGDDDFDRQFLIRGDDEQEVRQLLTDGVRWQIQRLRDLIDDDGLYILITHGRIYIQKPRLVRRYANLKHLVQRSFELYDQAMITQAVGIEFVDSDEAQSLDGVICKVCGESIESDLVFCQRCKTPHHGECWHYAGACSVYGCQERTYLRPQAATQITKPHAGPPRETEHPSNTEGLQP